MKRANNLYESIISIENLKLADKKAQKCKRNQKGVIEHNKNKEYNILKLNEILKNRTYKTSRYFVFKIFEGKERVISKLPYFPDRICHHAIMNIIEPILKECLISQTYSCIKGKGIIACLRDLNNALKDRQNTIYCLKIDIKKFYPSLSHDILKDKLKSKFKDENLLELLFEIIDSNKNGVPLGNLLSQWFANFYLNGFDHWIKEEKKVKYYFRYADDLIILHSDKYYLHNLKREIEGYLLTYLNLQLSNKQVFKVINRGINYIGYKSYHSHIRLRNSIKKNWVNMLRKYPNRKSKASYNGWLCHANTYNLQQKYLNNGNRSKS